MPHSSASGQQDTIPDMKPKMSNNLKRVLIMGNSGSGKSWLAARLTELTNLPVTDLDTLNWESAGYGKARKKVYVLNDVQAIANQDRWIIEGIYGWIAAPVALYATKVIWLTPDSNECVENIKARGIRNNGSPEEFAALLEWASSYETRTGSSSYEGHLKVFSKARPESQVKLTSREDMHHFLLQR
ncbi:hypothetical protein [Pantoea sp. ACRSB]|uniref:hypothetical protein n=1 Tax=Pantoea sp. ACRSB TaxID=2918207 RepID=UPI0028932DA9|nr:hypothetical protein [Pantoea sp. ACRSB]MCG7389699.1 hypothetical protein [Pantoea sp. ACRSB]